MRSEYTIFYTSGGSQRAFSCRSVNLEEAKLRLDFANRKDPTYRRFGAISLKGQSLLFPVNSEPKKARLKRTKCLKVRSPELTPEFDFSDVESDWEREMEQYIRDEDWIGEDDA